MFDKVKNFLHTFIHATGNQIDEVTTMNPTSRDDFLFTENHRSTQIYAELLTGNPDRLIDGSSIMKWLPPHENEPLTQEDRERILQKVSLYFDRFNETYEIV